MRVQAFGFSEVLKVTVVCDNFKWVIGSLQPVMSFFQSQFDNLKLPITDVTVLLPPGITSRRKRHMGEALMELPAVATAPFPHL